MAVAQFGRQMVLPFGTRHDASFENFFGEVNQRVAKILLQALDEDTARFVYLDGPEGAGKTHLSVAALNRMEIRGALAGYLSMAELAGAPEEFLRSAFESMLGYRLVIIEDVEHILPSDTSEVLLFDLFNEVNARGSSLMLTSKCSVDQLGIRLPDLASRLKSGLTLRLSALNDAEKLDIFRSVASERGLQVSDDLMVYLIRRSPRDLGQLMSILGTLDEAAWTQKQKLTIPFARKVLGW